jgi:uncharacterized coiled-coil protein SlyX
MTTNQPDSIETRLTRLETLFANVGETVAAQNKSIDALTANVSQQSDTIDVLVANISQLAENLNNISEQTDRKISNLVEQAAQDRQQAAIDRQQADIDRQAWQAEIQRIWEYLLQQRGNGRQGV